MRAATSVALAALAALAHPQAFGRFGYVDTQRFFGLVADKEGFATDYPVADRLRFAAPATEWTPIETTEFDQTVRLGPDRPGAPSRIRFSLLAPGISLYFPRGIRLRVGSTAAPYLTWGDGSGSDGIPTPSVRWAALSFRDAQPAMLLGFPDGAASLQISGKPGAWEIRSDAYVGWMRVGLPRGLVAEPTNSAAALGRLAQASAAAEPLLARPLPEYLGFNAVAEPDGNAVVATWRFDRPGFLLPTALMFAKLGGYPLALRTASHRLKSELGLGEVPRDVSDSADLRVRFPIRRIPIGRAIALGEPGPPIGTVSPQDAPSVAELALENLLGNRDAQTRKAAEDGISQFLADAVYTKEPATQQQLSFDAAGNGIDLTAAHALLAQALTTTTQPDSGSNALLTSVGWRRDWQTWLPWVADADRRRRAASFAILAGALCPEPNRRVGAGMLQAGLAAERGINIWRRRSGRIASEPPLLEPLLGVRTGLLRLTLPRVNAEPFVETILSPLRVFSDEAVGLSAKDGQLTLGWPVVEAKAGTLSLASSFPLDLTVGANLPRFVPDRVLGLCEVAYTPEAAGTCELKLKLPPWIPRLPVLHSAPRYTEPRL